MRLTDRYRNNEPFIAPDEQRRLHSKTAAVVGLGGLGGQIAEQLARLGIGKIILIDADTVEARNLNRQLFATEDTVGLPKAAAALHRLNAVNSGIEYAAHNVYLTEQNGGTLLAGADIALDALDNIPARWMLEGVCKSLGIPLVHGSIGGGMGQACFIMPGDDSLRKIYPQDARPSETGCGSPAFMPAVVASIQVAEAVKFLLGRGGLLRRKLLRIDVMNHEYRVFELGG